MVQSAFRTSEGPALNAGEADCLINRVHPAMLSTGYDNAVRGAIFAVDDRN